jgi:putative FmdB family regulatory protein
MPLLKFSCTKCGDTFDLFLSWSEARKSVTCPTCKSQIVERVSGTSGNAPKADRPSCSLSKKS